MATVFREPLGGGGDPVIIEDPGSMMLNQGKGRLLIKSIWKLPALEDNRFQAIWLAKVSSVSITERNSDGDVTAVHGPFLSPGSVVVNNGAAASYTSGVFSFAGARVTNVDPPAKMTLDPQMEGDYYVYYNVNIADPIKTVVVDGGGIDVTGASRVQIGFSIERS